MSSLDKAAATGHSPFPVNRTFSFCIRNDNGGVAIDCKTECYDLVYRVNTLTITGVSTISGAPLDDSLWAVRIDTDDARKAHLEFKGTTVPSGDPLSIDNGALQAALNELLNNAGECLSTRQQLLGGVVSQLGSALFNPSERLLLAIQDQEPLRFKLAVTRLGSTDPEPAVLTVLPRID